MGKSFIGSVAPGFPSEALPKSRFWVHEAGQCWERGRLVRIRSEPHCSRR
jgi:hypothetical protein